MPSLPVSLKCLKPKDSDFAPRTIGEHVKKRRLELKLTQKAVARTLRVSQFSVINWERGRSQPTRAPTLRRIIVFIGYDPLPPGITLPDRLRAKRREMGWGQRELADHLGVDRCTVTDWEAGGTILMRDHRVRAARLLGLSEAEIMAAMAIQWHMSHRKPPVG